MSELTWIDKSDWGEGEWQNEPDRIEWVDETTGYPCLMVRGPMGAWCGYVAVSPGHSLHGVEYMDYTEDTGIYVHGGVTFSGPCQQEDKEHGICHVAAEGDEDNVWWIGFDTAHAFDFVPLMERNLRKYQPERADFEEHLPAPWKGRYRDVAYMRTECTMLAEQLADKK